MALLIVCNRYGRRASDTLYGHVKAWGKSGKAACSRVS